jgi:hypothetical protein
MKKKVRIRSVKGKRVTRKKEEKEEKIGRKRTLERGDTEGASEEGGRVR